MKVIGTQVSAPYAHEKSSVRRTMLTVLAALSPALAMGFYVFGWPAILLTLTTIAAALCAEAMAVRLSGRPVAPALLDGSGLLTAVLLAMTLPPWAPWWIGVVGAVLAIIIGKQVFGGIGQNVFNPAMVARVALLISFPLEMTQFVAPAPLGSVTAPSLGDALAITFAGAADFDAVSSASLLGFVKTELSRAVPLAQSLAEFDLLALAIGTTPGSLGETSAVLLFAGGLFLIFRGIISWRIPVSLLVTLTLLATIANLVDPNVYAGPLVHVVSGATMLGAFFIATDPVTSPVTPRGQILFGAGLALLIFTIRAWAGYPEGVAFAVLLMNAVTPLIDRYIRPRVYGRTPKGDPIRIEKAGAPR